jgi:uncharacterized protein YyaL (SSP411 family)
MEMTGDAAYLARAEAWMARLDEAFLDRERGGYFANQADTQGLLVRNRPAQDNAAPSANAAALMALSHLASLTGNPDYDARGQALFAALSGLLANQYPSMTSLLLAHGARTHRVSVIIVSPTDATDANAHALRQAALRHHITGKSVLVVSAKDSLPASHPAHGKTLIDGAATAYICPGMSCLPPVTSASAVQEMLDGVLTDRQNSDQT